MLTKWNDEKLEVPLPIWRLGREHLDVRPQYRIDERVRADQCDPNGRWGLRLCVAKLLNFCHQTREGGTHVRRSRGTDDSAAVAASGPGPARRGGRAGGGGRNAGR